MPSVSITSLIFGNLFLRNRNASPLRFNTVINFLNKPRFMCNGDKIFELVDEYHFSVIKKSDMFFWPVLLVFFDIVVPLFLLFHVHILIVIQVIGIWLKYPHIFQEYQPTLPFTHWSYSLNTGSPNVEGFPNLLVFAVQCSSFGSPYPG